MGTQNSIGHNKWELYNVKDGDRESGNFGSIKYEAKGNDEEHKHDGSLITEDCRGLVGETCLVPCVCLQR